MGDGEKDGVSVLGQVNADGIAGVVVGCSPDMVGPGGGLVYGDNDLVDGSCGGR